MAIAFARITYHSRSQGHSAVAGAAYRAGVTLKDERTGEIHNFKNRSDVLYSEILLPEGASEKFKDREILWNAVEAAEIRKNSQIAKDVVLALPRDLNLISQIDLARNFTQYHFIRHGLAADIAIHNHSDGNPHAHIYVSTRRLKGDHFDKYKARDLEPGVARGRIVDPQYWGEQWREFQNNYFIEHNIELIVDANHIISQRHEGRIRGQRSHYLKEENYLRRQASIEISLNDPAALLNLLGSKHAVFTDRDIALLINKNTQTREEYETALLRIKSHPELILLGVGDHGRNCYTTRANYHCEAAMAKQASVLSGQYKHAVSASLVQQASHDFNLNEEQFGALLYIANSGDISAVVGRAGTGKSYLMRAARQMWEVSGYRIYGIAFSGVASKNLETASGISSRTICSLKMQLGLGKLKIGPKDILVMDEAGMTDLHDLARIVSITKTLGAKLVLLGDPAQLQPIGPGAPFRAITEQIGFVELKQIQRQSSPGDCVASRYLSQGYIDKAIDHYALQQQVHFNSQEEDEEGEGGDVGGRSVQLRLVIDWSRGLTSETVSSRLILAHRNTDVIVLNQMARRQIQTQGLLGIDACTVDTIQGPIVLAVGDRILFLCNDKQLGVSNGEFATITNLTQDKISVRLGKQQTREMTFSINEYRDFTYGYAATVHKSQGATYDDVFVYISGHYWDRFLTYVAMTRHRKTLNVYVDKSQFNDLAALKKALSRSVLKDSVLDWPLSFAIRRGFDPDKLIGWFIDKVLGIKQVVYDSWLFIVNYAAFQKKKYHRNLLRSKMEKRELAKKVALFVDLRNGLSKQSRQMRHDLIDGKKFYDHPDYVVWYEKTLLRNQLAFEIKQNHVLFEQALASNRIDIQVIEKLALKHEYAIRVKNYLMQYNEAFSVFRYELAEKINTDFKNHFSAIRHFSEKEGLSTKAFIERVKKDIKPLDQTYGYKEEGIDWKSDKLDIVFDKIKTSNDSKLHYLSKLRHLLKNINDNIKEKRLIQRLELISVDIVKSRLRLENLKLLVPTFASKLEEFVRFKSKIREIGRDS